jgi:ABC-2 type transport system ATP-binding protein
MNMIEVDSLVKKYDSFTAVNGVSFHLNQGELFGLLGPNGAGKTTTINTLTGLAHITSGSAKIAGLSYPGGLKQAQRLIGVVPDESNLYEELDGFDNLCFCASLYGMARKQRQIRAGELLEQFNLIEVGDRPFKAYSKGMKRKLTIAAGIIHDPRILFLDEPTTGIDVASARQIRSLIQQLHSQGTTILLTTHYIEEAERLCQRIAFLVKGKIVRSGNMKELMQEVQQEHIIQLTVSDMNETFLGKLARAFPEIQIKAIEGNSIRCLSPQPLNVTPLIVFLDRLGLSVFEAKIIRPTLEDVFFKVTGIGLDQMKQEKPGGGGGKGGGKG